jgi:TRAP-type mannitol/chloroaromatic compound transport system permease small subunit
MAALRRLITGLDALAEYTGRVLCFFALCMAVGTALIVVLRYGFSIGSIAAQEAIVYLHGCLFMLGAAYTFKHDGHVRVDVFYRRFNARQRAWVNAVGGIVFLLPLCGLLLAGSWQFVSESWLVRESSPEADGIAAVYLLKSLIPLMALLLLLQGIAELARNALVLVARNE